jgi:hypothetical protein
LGRVEYCREEAPQDATRLQLCQPAQDPVKRQLVPRIHSPSRECVFAQDFQFFTLLQCAESDCQIEMQSMLKPLLLIQHRPQCTDGANISLNLSRLGVTVGPEQNPVFPF